MGGQGPCRPRPSPPAAGFPSLVLHGYPWAGQSRGTEEEGGEASLAWWIYSFQQTWRERGERERGWEGGQDALLPRQREEAATVAGFALGFGAPSPLPESRMGPLLVTGVGVWL